MDQKVSDKICKKRLLIGSEKMVIDTGASGVTLKLDKTPDFLDRLQQSLSKGKDDDKYQRVRECKVIGKMNPRSYSALKVKVGLWEKSADNENDIVVKFYFNQGRFLWEILHDQRKYKMEVSMDDVSALRAAFNEETTYLFIQLKKPPAFLKEDDPISQKRATWTTIADFTHGQAQKNRWHGLTFRKEVFGKSQYEEIIYSKPDLYLKSCSRFQSTNSLYFEGVPNDVGGSLLEVLDQLNPHCLPNQTHGNSASEVQHANANSPCSSSTTSINSSVQPNYSGAAEASYKGTIPMRDINSDRISPMVSQMEEQPISTPVPNPCSRMHNVDPQTAQFRHGEMDQVQEGTVQNSLGANGACINPTEAMHGLAGNREITLHHDDEHGVLEQLRPTVD